MLRRVVRCPIRNAEQPRNRGNVDDGTAPRVKHLLSKDFCQKKWRHKINLDHTAIVGESGVFCCRDQTDAGVVHQDINSSIAIDDSFGEASYRCFIRNVASVTYRLAGLCFNCLYRLRRLMKVDDGKPEASLGEQLCGPPTDALRSASNHCDSSVRVH